jgi:hypothetical protein
MNSSDTIRMNDDPGQAGIHSGLVQFRRHRHPRYSVCIQFLAQVDAILSLIALYVARVR